MTVLFGFTERGLKNIVNGIEKCVMTIIAKNVHSFTVELAVQRSPGHKCPAARLKALAASVI